MGQDSDAFSFEYKGTVRGVDCGLDPLNLTRINEIAEQLGGIVASACIGHNLDSERLRKRGASRAPHVRFRFRSRRLAERVSKMNWAGERGTRIGIFKSGDWWYASISRAKGSRSLDVKRDWWDRAVCI